MADGLFNPGDPLMYDELAALRGSIPKPANVVPTIETTGGGVGTDPTYYSQVGHSHPRLTSTTMTVLTADGTANVTFTRTFTNKPGVVMTEIDTNSSQPLVLVVVSYVMSGGLYTGCVVKGYRSQALPNQPQISVASLLTALINGVNALASSLTGYNVFGGTTAGSNVSVVAIARSDVPA